jgi:non-canonical (house-cleaning) NTP pyrophosphatase
MPTLAVGTTNPGKVAAVRAALAAYPALADFSAAPSKVDSGVSEQPRTLDETTRGARNRAQRAAAGSGPRAFGIGMESGLFESDGRLFNLCAPGRKR